MCAMAICDDLLKECAKAINFSVDAPITIEVRQGTFPFSM